MKKWESWKAYGDLFQIVMNEMTWKPKELAEKMTQDANGKSLPRCTYCERDFDYWKAPPKNGKNARTPRIYRREHIHQFLSQKIDALGKSAEFASRLAAIAPHPTNVQSTEQAIPKKHKRGAAVKIYLSLFSPKLKPLELPFNTLRDVNDLTHKVFHEISRFVEPYHYGDTWVLRNRKSGEVIKNRRMLENLGWGQPQTDPRPLSDVGITAGSELEAIPTP